MRVIANPWRPNEPADGRVVRWWATANLIANIGIILTGGLVRLTGSGLGCPTWPKCTEDSFVPQGALGWHGAIEFGNRMLTYVLIAVVVSTTVAVWRWSKTTTSLRALALAIAVSIPLQGVIGGVTVLTDLNPWIVALHLMLSMVLVALSTWLLMRVDDRAAANQPRSRGIAAVHPLALAVFATTWLAIYLGTVVTGAGPHAGDRNAPRNGLDPQVVSHVHAASVYLLLGLTIVLIWRSWPSVTARAALMVGAVQLGQGLIGVVQYVNDLPIVLVAAHLVGAAVLVVATTRLVIVDARSGYTKLSAAAATNSSAR